MTNSRLALQAFTWSNNITYFFKGSDYYQWYNETNAVDAGYPIAISAPAGWPGVPDNLDAALRYTESGGILCPTCSNELNSVAEVSAWVSVAACMSPLISRTISPLSEQLICQFAYLSCTLKLHSHRHMKSDEPQKLQIAHAIHSPLLHLIYLLQG